jgi:hypothetical protein
MSVARCRSPRSDGALRRSESRPQTLVDALQRTPMPQTDTMIKWLRATHTCMLCKRGPKRREDPELPVLAYAKTNSLDRSRVSPKAVRLKDTDGALCVRTFECEDLITKVVFRLKPLAVLQDSAARRRAKGRGHSPLGTLCPQTTTESLGAALRPSLLYYSWV